MALEWSGGLVCQWFGTAGNRAFYWTLRYYDSGEFIGLRQWREQVDPCRIMRRFHLSPLHRFVRHPWYFLGLVLIWSRDMNSFLLTAIVITLYFWLGSKLEEKKLLLVPRQRLSTLSGAGAGIAAAAWRYLSRAVAEEMERMPTKDEVLTIDELMRQCGVQFGTSGARGLAEAMTDRVCYAYTSGFLGYLERERFQTGHRSSDWRRPACEHTKDHGCRCLCGEGSWRSGG